DVSVGRVFVVDDVHAEVIRVGAAELAFQHHVCGDEALAVLVQRHIDVVVAGQVGRNRRILRHYDEEIFFTSVACRIGSSDEYLVHAGFKYADESLATRRVYNGTTVGAGSYGYSELRARHYRRARAMVAIAVVGNGHFKEYDSR